MKLLDIEELHQQQESVEKKVEKPSASVIPMAASSEYTSYEDNEDEEDNDFIKIKFTWVRNAIAVAAVLLAIFVLALPTGKTEMMTRTISNLNNTILFGMMSKDTNTSTIEIKKQDLEHKVNRVDTVIKKSVIPPQQPQAKADSVKQSGYCIVLASYVTKQNAKIFIEQLQDRGYQDSRIFVNNNITRGYQDSRIFVNNNITRVVYGHFDNQNDAYNALRDIHKHKDLSEAWVYKIN